MTRVFVGGLPEDVRERDLSDKFASFGRISSITIKFPPRSPPFAFIVRRFPALCSPFACLLSFLGWAWTLCRG